MARVCEMITKAWGTAFWHGDENGQPDMVAGVAACLLALGL